MQKRALFLFIPMIGLLVLAFAQTEDKVVSNSNLSVLQIAGKRLFELKKCADCHTLAEEAEGKLTPVTNKRSDDFFAEHAEKESPIVLREEKSKRRQRRVLRDEIEALDELLYNTKDAERAQIDAMPEAQFHGAYLAYQNNCLNCHKIAGQGKDVGPDLTKVGAEHDKQWFIANLKNPQQFADDSVMPKFDHLPEEALSNIAEYLTSLR